jgi:hypothetical protein
MGARAAVTGAAVGVLVGAVVVCVVFDGLAAGAGVLVFAIVAGSGAAGGMICGAWLLAGWLLDVLEKPPVMPPVAVRNVVLPGR